MSAHPLGDSAEAPLADLPLRETGGSDLFSLPPGADSDATAAPAAAPLGPRAAAFAADLAGASLAVTLALVAATAVSGRPLRLAGLPWAAAFGLEFSFFFAVLPLTLFGRTVGMSLAGLAASPGPSGRRMTAGAASRRWAGTLLAAAGLGLPLLFTARDAGRPTPADRLSRRPLTRDEAGSRL